MDKKENCLYVKGKAISVSEKIDEAYWKITEHEKYLYRKDREHCVLSFSLFNYGGHFVDDTIID